MVLEECGQAESQQLQGILDVLVRYRMRIMADTLDITSILERISDGDGAALDELTPLVYAELHRLAKRQFTREHGQHTLQPTALVNEAYLQLANASVDWNNRSHFFALAARMMRRILVNHVNARQAAKRGGKNIQVTFNEALLGDEPRGEEILELDEAIQALHDTDKEQADFIELFYFGGLNYQQIAELRDTSASSVKRKLRFARAWINRFLDDTTDG